MDIFFLIFFGCAVVLGQQGLYKFTKYAEIEIIEIPTRYLVMLYLLMAVFVIGSLAMMLTGGADASFVLGPIKLQVTWVGWRFMAILALFFPLHIYTCKNTECKKEVLSPSFVFFIISLLVSATFYHIYAFVHWEYDIADAQWSILIPAMVFWCTYNILYLPIMSAFCVLERNDGGDDA
ncbi:hypothetical protein NGC36_21110 [Serratia rubidaea]|uniref:hypothetical protein n=1 Tax=Serratia rubidaea TaxID=61652 RepID=UPI002DB6C9C8|nr:hypothetical protein [Serratia rubidaea]MEB7587769.1 hypothetical protein [Serratia rubidaea]